MDDLVRQAMAKWPDVPHCYGWLGLDARGQWYMRDDQVQAAGPFVLSKGSVLRHEKLIEFIHRNYEPDPHGCWYFQNGPQRVYVELSHTPYVWRIEPDGTVCAHTGASTEVQQVWLDEQGLAYLQTGLGFGLVHTMDTQRLATLMDAQGWTWRTLQACDIPERFGFVKSPQARQQG